jgi:hypothetical protein
MDFENPYLDDRRESPGETSQRMASMAKELFLLIDVHLTRDEEAALAKVLGAILRGNPWLLDIPGILPKTRVQ